MKIFLPLTLVLGLSTGQATTYTAKQVCKQLVAESIYKPEGWQSFFSPNQHFCTPIPFSILQAKGANFNNPIYTNMIEYVEDKNFILYNKTQTLNYILMINTYRTAEDAARAYKLFNNSSNLYKFNKENFIVLIKVLDIDEETKREEATLVKSLGRKKVDEIYKQLDSVKSPAHNTKHNINLKVLPKGLEDRLNSALEKI